MGENGAGKSTLIKALTGVYPIDSGAIVVAGRARRLAGTADAQSAGIAVVYQEVNLCPNLVDRRERHARPRGARAVRDRLAARTHAAAADALAGLGLDDLDTRRPLSSISLAHAAARRDQPGDGHRLTGADPRRTHLEPRRQRGRAPLHGDPTPPRQRRRDPVRLALPRPGLRDQRPDHRAARRAGRSAST